MPEQPTFYEARKSSVKRAPVFLFFLVLLIIILTKTSIAFDGPLTVSNDFPLSRPVGAPILMSADPETSIHLGVQYSSMNLFESSDDWRVQIDFELITLTLRIRKKILPSTEASLELPFFSFNSGILDDFLIGYHRLFDLPDYGRSNRPLNSFLYEVTRNGKTVIKGKAGEIAPGDVKAGVKHLIYDGDPLVSLYGFLEFPSGDPDRGYGNGDFDYGAAILVNKVLRQNLMAYLNGGVVFLTN
jgi:hypothetical protein